MVRVGDHVRLSTAKGAGRDGVVVGMTGALLRLRWPSGEETSVVPAAGTLSVLDRPSGAGAKKPKKKADKQKDVGAKKAKSSKR